MVSTLLHHYHFHACIGQLGGHGCPARTRADDNDIASYTQVGGNITLFNKPAGSRLTCPRSHRRPTIAFARVMSIYCCLTEPDGFPVCCLAPLCNRRDVRLRLVTDLGLRG